MGGKNEQCVIQLLSTTKETFKKGIWSAGVRCEWKGSLNSSSGRPPDKRHLNKGEGGKPNIIIGRRHRTAGEQALKPKYSWTAQGSTRSVRLSRVNTEERVRRSLTCNWDHTLQGLTRHSKDSKSFLCKISRKGGA